MVDYLLTMIGSSELKASKGDYVKRKRMVSDLIVTNIYQWITIYIDILY